MAVIARALPYARGDGLATAFLGGSWPAVALGGGAAALGLGAVAEGAAGALAVLAGLTASAAVAAAAHRRIGGFTGDVLGAAGVIGETIALLVAAASW
jgi:adenosylcobinamide-GDP ribazoletransferase